MKSNWVAGSTLDVKVLLVILVKHRIRDVRNISTCIALSRDVYLMIADAERILRLC